MDYERDRVNRLIEKNTKILWGLLVVALLAGVLQAAGYSTPGWIVLSGTDDENVTFSAGIGLWYQRICTDECEIGFISGTLMAKDEHDTFETIKLVATLSLALSIFCPVVIFLYLRRIRLQQDIISQAGAAVLAALGSGVVALVVVGIIASDVHTEYDDWIENEKDTDFKLGLLYSALLMGLGGALDCLAFIGLCLQIFFRKRDTGDSGGEETVGMTTGSK